MKVKEQEGERYNVVNEVSCPICVGMEPESWLKHKFLEKSGSYVSHWE